MISPGLFNSIDLGLNTKVMKKIDLIGLLLRNYSLEPFNVEKTESGWQGKGVDVNNDVVIDFTGMSGFKAVVAAILSQAHSAELKPVQY